MSNLNKIYSNISNMLPELIKDINEIINNSTNNVNIKILGNVINKINYIINENKNIVELLRNNILSLLNQMNKRFDKLNINILIYL